MPTDAKDVRSGVIVSCELPHIGAGTDLASLITEPSLQSHKGWF